MVLRLICIAFLLFLSCGEPSFDNPTDPRNISHPSNAKYTHFTDSKDGKSYKSVVIGTQTWMAENLNRKISGSFCIDNVEHNGTIKDTLVSDGGYCDIYGRLYNWAAAKDVCPSGWHLPSNWEWTRLLTYASSWTKLKSKKGWAAGQQGTDIYGFSALPGGSEDEQIILGSNGCWWSATEEEAGRAYIICTNNYKNFWSNITSHNSVRCVKDELCGSKTFNTVIQFCDNGNLYDLCGYVAFDPTNQQCNANNEVVTKPSSSSSLVSSSSLNKSSSSISSSSISSSSVCTAEDNDYDYYCSNGTLKEYGFVIDEDGQDYKTVEIGTQTWMAENLNYDVPGSKCYDDYDYNCYLYGRLYDWMTVMALPSNCSSRSCANLIEERKDICPIGWHIPSNAEWNILIATVGGSASAGRRLKAIDGWMGEGLYDGNGKDTYGFAALPGGSGILDIESYGGWWSSSEGNPNRSHYWFIRYDYDDVSNDLDSKVGLHSVRCIMD